MSDEITKPIEESVVGTAATEVVGNASVLTPIPSPVEAEVKQVVKESSPVETPVAEVVKVEIPLTEEKVETIEKSEEVKEVISPPSTPTPSPTVTPIAPSPLPPEPILKPEPKVEPIIEPKPEVNPTPVTAPTISSLDRIALSFKANMLKARENLVLAHKAKKAKMMKSVYKVMDLFKKKKSIKNMDVQKFVHVSDSTATDYLNILTKEGKIKKEGKPTAPKYTKVE